MKTSRSYTFCAGGGFLLALILLIANPGVRATCERNQAAIPYSNKCYWVTPYKYGDRWLEKMTWAEAAEECKNENATLAEISTVAEKDALNAYMQGAVFERSKDKDYWTDIFWIAQKGNADPTKNCSAFTRGDQQTTRPCNETGWFICQKISADLKTTYDWKLLTSYDFSDTQNAGNPSTTTECTYPVGWSPTDKGMRNINGTCPVQVADKKLIVQAQLPSNNDTEWGFYQNFAGMRTDDTFRVGSNPGRKIKVEVTGRFPTVLFIEPEISLIWLNFSYRVPNSYLPTYLSPTKLFGMEFWWTQNLNMVKRGDRSFDYLRTAWTYMKHEDISGQFNTYGVEISNVPNDEYIRQYVIRPNGTVTNDNIYWLKNEATQFSMPACDGWMGKVPATGRTRGAEHCSYISPFDDPFSIGIDLQSFTISDPQQRDTFLKELEKGVKIEISSIKVYH